MENSLSKKIDTLNNISSWMYKLPEDNASQTFIIGKSKSKSAIEQLADHVINLELQQNKGGVLEGINNIKIALDKDRQLRRHLAIILENAIDNQKEIRDILARSSIALD